MSIRRTRTGDRFPRVPGEDSHRSAQTVRRPSSATLRPLEGEYSFAAVSSSRSASSASPVLLVLGTRTEETFEPSSSTTLRRIRVHCRAARRLDPDRARVRRRSSCWTCRHRPPQERRDDAPGDAAGSSSTSRWRRCSRSGCSSSAAGTSGSEFVAGYITEYSLSVDNLFVFIIIMARFAVPAARRGQGALHRHRRVDAAARRLHRGRAPRPSPPPAGSSTSSARS